MNRIRSRSIPAVAGTCMMLLGATPGGIAEEWRTWKSSAGTSLEAKWVSSDDTQVTLERKDGTKLVVKPSQLSAEDREFLAAMAKAAEPAIITEIEGISAKPGVISPKIPCADDPKWSYHLYLPNDFHIGRKWPVCFVMDPGGGSSGTLGRYLPAAERLGVILAVSVESKNGFADSDLAMMAMAGDVYRRVPVIGNLAIASGMSGGSRMAYLMAEMEENVGGVLACGSGGGVYLKASDFRQAELRRGTAICSLIGSNDFNRREAVRSHKGFGKEDRILWFPGNHDWAGEELIVEGMADVLGRMLRDSKDPDLEALRVAYADSQLAWAKDQQATKPWLAYRRADFLSNFPSSTGLQREASSLAAVLMNEADVLRAIKADKVIADFANKYLAEGSSQVDSDPDPSREKEAVEEAADFQGLPQAGILERLGKPSPPP